MLLSGESRACCGEVLGVYRRAEDVELLRRERLVGLADGVDGADGVRVEEERLVLAIFAGDLAELAAG